jgi:AAA domain-containing protein
MTWRIRCGHGLDASGADVRRVHVPTGWTSETDQGGISLADIEVIEEAVRRTGAKLVVIAPLQAFLGGRVDMHRANETRLLLAAVASMAERCGCMVLIIRHLSKALQDRAIYRGLGSIDFTAAARSILLAGQDPQHPHQRVLAHAKSSLAPLGASLIYELREGQFLWAGQSDLTADALVRPYPLEEERSVKEEAQDFLREFLADGPKAAKEVIKEARKAGIAEKTLNRAKDGLIKARKSQVEGQSYRDAPWVWGLTSLYHFAMDQVHQSSQPKWLWSEESGPVHALHSEFILDGQAEHAPRQSDDGHLHATHKLSAKPNSYERFIRWPTGTLRGC